jgi:hypothetical protein
MPRARCTNCGAVLAYAEIEACCLKCGWNSRRTQTRLAGIRRALTFGFVCSVGVGTLFALARSWAPLIPLGFILLIIVFLWAMTRGAMAKIQLATAGSPGSKPKSGATDKGGKSVEYVRAESRVLLSLPRPRPIRVSFQGKISIGIGLLVFAFGNSVIIPMLITPLRHIRGVAQLTSGFWILLAFDSLWNWIVISNISFELLARRLLREGEVTVGRITDIWHVRRGSRMTYEFLDSTGHNYVKDGKASYGDKGLIGTALLVFFDKENPRKCTTYHQTHSEVVLPQLSAGPPIPITHSSGSPKG